MTSTPQRSSKGSRRSRGSHAFNLTKAAYTWAFKHLKSQGDTDLLPVPFEIDVLYRHFRTNPDAFTGIDINTYPWRGGQSFLVPRKRLSFRKAVQLNPLDSVVASALMYRIAPKLEASRIPTQDNHVFSYRVDVQHNGTLYKGHPSWRDFWSQSHQRARRPDFNYVVRVDISDFYNQVYHHAIERQYAKAGLDKRSEKAITKLLQGLTGKQSRGVPVGPHFSHILAECALDEIDRGLLSQGYLFCRYVDDFNIFTRTREDAIGAIYHIARSLDTQGLVLQDAKTEIHSAERFAEYAAKAKDDFPSSTEEHDVIKLIMEKSHGDPYRHVAISSLSQQELQMLSQEMLERLLLCYLPGPSQLAMDQIAPAGPEVNFSRLGWLIRRLSQLGVPGALEMLLNRLADLGPILGPISEYIAAAVPNYRGDRKAIGEKLVDTLSTSVVAASPYLQVVLLDVLEKIPELNHVDRVTPSYARSDPSIQRVLLGVAAEGGRTEWLRERKGEFSTMNPWLRRAYLRACASIPGTEAKFWIESVLQQLTGIEKLTVARFHTQNLPKLGEIRLLE